MLQHNIYKAFFVSVLMCCSQLALAAPVVKEKLSPLHADAPESEESYAEVPIESIQQFVQIYGIVRDNYVDEKSDDALFLQAIKGLVSGLDRYSRYLSAE
ncbi:S41 family peptidase, partial [Acinetobacter baumannii]